MKACLKCGGTSGYLIKVRALGTVTHRGFWDVIGGDEKIIRSDLSFVADKTVKCIDCGKRTLMKAMRNP